MDEYSVNKYYQITLTQLDGVIRLFHLSEDDFYKNKDLLKWIEFLVLTGQWIPFALYHDALGINETMYEGLVNVTKMDIKFIETVTMVTDIDLDII